MVDSIDRETSDQELLRIAVGEPDGVAGRRAASRLLRRHQDKVYGWCFRYLREHERALDLAQEVLMIAYRDLSSFAGRSRFSTWLYAVTRNRCLMEIRRPALLVDEEADLDTLRSASRPDRELEERLDEESVLALIRERLSGTEQDALWLRCYERLPVETITEMLGISESAGARTVLQRARRKLRAALDEREGTFGEER